MPEDRPRRLAGRFRPGAAASIAPYDVGRVVRTAIEEARRAGLPYSRQTEHAVQALRQIDPDLTAEQAYRAVVLERRRQSSRRSEP